MAPIVPDMVSKIGIREEDLGFYCGLVLSSHAVAQTVGMLFWSKWSDSKGRKPILIWCLIGAALSIAAFGYARTVWEMILIRCVMGVFSASEL
jgi:MFS family permease